jgi:hypothetical protein
MSKCKTTKLGIALQDFDKALAGSVVVTQADLAGGHENQRLFAVIVAKLRRREQLVDLGDRFRVRGFVVGAPRLGKTVRQAWQRGEPEKK